MKILMISPQPFFEPRDTPINVYRCLETLDQTIRLAANGICHQNQ